MSFVFLVFALSIPFWIVGGITDLDLLPGLPLAALMSFTPAVAACFILYWERGTEGVTGLLKRSADYRRIRQTLWYIPILFLMPAIMVASYGLMRWMRFPLPAPRIPILMIPALFLAFLLAAVGEELGWSGYATGRMQARWGELRAALVLGVVWAGWHLVPLIQAHRSVDWIAGWTLGTVANRIIIVWLYNGSGRSVFAAALYHATSNLTWQLFPNQGSHYDPRVSGVLLAIAAAIIVASSRSALQIGDRPWALQDQRSTCESGRL